MPDSLVGFVAAIGLSMIIGVVVGAVAALLQVAGERLGDHWRGR